MAFTEITSARARRSKTYQQGNVKRYLGWTVPIHHQSIVDSGDYDSEVNFEPRRVTNPAGFPEIDGFVVSDGDYYYGLQTEPPTGNQKPVGTFFFGGRKGQDFITFRLRQLGYVHWPTRTYQGLATPSGGSVTPDYTKANLSSVTHYATVDPNLPNGDELSTRVNTGFTSTWANIWTTPGGGTVDLVIKGTNNNLKLEVVVSKIAREWIAANRPPLTPTNETYFGQIFDIDYTGINLKRADLTTVTPGTDEEGDSFQFHDSLDRLLSFLPVDYLYAGDAIKGSGVKEIQQIPLKKRFYRDAGTDYFIIGARVDEINGTNPGRLVFDPTFGPSEIAADVDDCLELYAGIYASGQSGEIHMGDKYGGDSNGGFQFDVTIGQGETINSASIEFKPSSSNSTANCNLNIYVHDDLTPTAWQGGTFHPSDVVPLATANSPVAWSTLSAWTVDTVASATTSPDLSAVVNDMIANVGWSSGTTMSFAFVNNASSNTHLRSAYDYGSVSGSKVAARLTIDYGAAATGANLLSLLGVG